jgi:hypothetical protein
VFVPEYLIPTGWLWLHEAVGLSHAFKAAVATQLYCPGTPTSCVWAVNGPELVCQAYTGCPTVTAPQPTGAFLTVPNYIYYTQQLVLLTGTVM